MHIKTLALHNFRNYERLIYAPDKGLNLIYGNNAQGKTNLLEAVFLCAFGRSQRTVHDDELIMRGKETAAVKTCVCSEFGGEHTVGIYLGQSKSIEIDGVRIKKLADLMGMVKAVMFSPESLSLVKGSPAERRRFMDMCISQLSRVYFYRLQQYNGALRQRNALLKSPDAARLRDYVAMWDEQLAASGAYIMTAREKFVKMLSPVACAVHDKLSCGTDTFEIKYAPSVKAEEDGLHESFAARLKNCFEDDLRRGNTGVGIHKDDISVKTNGLDSKIYASQGQQRTAALALRLSEIDFIKKVSGETPIVLLDDVFSELDADRCAALLECVGECQCIFTASQRLLNGVDGQMHMVKCEKGTLTSIN